MGMTLVTHQTGPEGKVVRKVLVEEALNIVNEVCLPVLPDRATASIPIKASEAAGMEIEEEAETYVLRLRPANRFSAYAMM